MNRTFEECQFKVGHTESDEIKIKRYADHKLTK